MWNLYNILFSSGIIRHLDNLNVLQLNALNISVMQKTNFKLEECLLKN